MFVLRLKKRLISAYEFVVINKLCLSLLVSSTTKDDGSQEIKVFKMRVICEGVQEILTLYPAPLPFRN